MAAEAGALRALFDHCVPHRVRPALKRGFWWGARHVCPVCDAHVRRYLPEGSDLAILRDLDVVGAQHRPERTCPVCRSDSRTRLAWLYLSREARLLDRAARVLHVAPEIGLYARFAQSASIDYEPGDLVPELYPWAPRLRRIDLAALPFPDADFDVVIANHVLEHVADDSRALAEIRRVLRPGGGLAVIFNLRDESVPWVRALTELTGVETAPRPHHSSTRRQLADWLAADGGYEPLRITRFRYAHAMTADTLVERVASQSWIAAMPDAERNAMFERVRELARSHPDLAGRASFEMPYDTEVSLTRTRRA